MAIRFGPIQCEDTAPSAAAEDSILLMKDGGELRIGTLTETADAFIDAGSHAVVLEERVFTEANGDPVAGQTYTTSVNIPAGAWILDVILFGQAVWDDTGAVTGIVGTSTPNDDNGYFTGIDMKATDLLAGEYLRAADISAWGGKEGAYLTAAGVQYQYLATARVVTAKITAANGNGSAGRTRLLVKYAVPSTSTAAAQAAT